MENRGIITGALLAFTSGFLNCYTYILGGGAFATMQTGNLIQATYNFTEGNWQKAFYFLCFNFIYMVTIFFSKWSMDTYYKKNERKWQGDILLFSIIGACVLGICAPKLPKIALNGIVACCAAMQYCAFRSFGEGDAYASIFCSGNMRSLVDNIYNVLIRKDMKCKRKVVGYFSIIASFVTGVVVSKFGVDLLREQAVWIVCIPLTVCYFRISYKK